MRLTLRTLLAYRDRVLSPADAEDLHRRIQSSQDAGNLLRRIGAVTQRNAVLAPPVLGKGLGGDPNTIAEYLDDALQHAQVPELERICLVSDVQLAELADCHSLLSTAIHTKVSVSSELRRMALALGDAEQRGQVELELEARKAPRRRGKRDGSIARHDVAHVTALPAEAKPHVAVQVASPMVVSGGESIKPQGLNLETTALTHEVPDYLMNSSAGNWKIPLAIGALAAVLAVLVWQSLGPWDKVRELFAKVPDSNRSINSGSRPIDFDLITETEQGPPGIVKSTSGKEEASNSAEAIVAKSKGGEVSAPIEIEIDDAAPPGAVPVPPLPRPAAPGISTEQPDAIAGAVENEPLATESAITTDSQLPVDGLAGAERLEGDEMPIDAELSAPPGLDAPATVDLTAELKAFSDKDAPPDAPNSRVPTADGTAGAQAVWLPSDAKAAQAVVLWRDGDVWRRVEAGAALPVGSRWVVPPATRTTIDLPKGVLWTVCGPSLLELATSNGAGDSPSTRIITPLCRALIRGGPEGRILHLSTPVGDFKLELGEPNSLASIEVAYRPVEAGSIVDRQSTKPVLIVVAAEDSLRVTPLGPDGMALGNAQVLKLGDGLACIAGSKPAKFRLQNIPTWFRTSVERPIDSLAASDLHLATQPKRAATGKGEATSPDALGVALGVTQQLDELSKSRRPETAALAVQVSLLCGNWHPLAAGFLDEVRMRSHWTPTLRLARQVLAADPVAEAEVRKAFEEAYAEVGPVLVELVCGIPADQLDAEALAKIVQRFESPQLALRVLAAYQLQLLTGKTLGVQPATIGRSGVQQWRRELATNHALLQPVPDPVWESIPN